MYFFLRGPNDAHCRARRDPRSSETIRVSTSGVAKTQNQCGPDKRVRRNARYGDGSVEMKSAECVPPDPRGRPSTGCVYACLNPARRTAAARPRNPIVVRARLTNDVSSRDRSRTVAKLARAVTRVWSRESDFGTDDIVTHQLRGSRRHLERSGWAFGNCELCKHDVELEKEINVGEYTYGTNLHFSLTTPDRNVSCVCF